MRNFLLAIPLLLLVAVAYLTFNLGVFKTVALQEGEYGDLLLLYRDHVGPYHKISDLINEAEKWAGENHIDCRKTFGQFLDDPQVVEHERLRSRAGCVLSQMPNVPAPDFKLMEIKKQNYVIAEFEGSPWIGPYKVYNKANYFAASRGQTLLSPVTEIYEVFNGNRLKTTYLFPSKKTDI